MEAKLKLQTHSIKLSEKQIETEMAQHFNSPQKNMLRMLNEKALDRAFQLHTAHN
ncbi:hypothetical protein [Thalassotalea sp. SU-HH00458]|uniref:hypothetical protein n=1 Tax=Thalassotalea sp. SU-HH00458 TaxID=3127657 RepID=UPI00310885BC